MFRAAFLLKNLTETGSQDFNEIYKEGIFQKNAYPNMPQDVLDLITIYGCIVNSDDPDKALQAFRDSYRVSKNLTSTKRRLLTEFINNK